MQRLDKLLASQGMLSRREVKELITKGRVTIDGTVEKHPERKVTGEEQIVVAGELLRVQRTLTLMLHKPQGVVSAARDAGIKQCWSWCRRNTAARSCSRRDGWIRTPQGS